MTTSHEKPSLDVKKYNRWYGSTKTIGIERVKKEIENVIDQEAMTPDESMEFMMQIREVIDFHTNMILAGRR